MEKHEPLATPLLPWDQIVRKAVHDIRNPLSSMRTNIEILRLTASPADQSERFLSSLDTQVDQIERYVRALIEEPESFCEKTPKV